MVNNQIYFGGIIFMSRKSPYAYEDKVKACEDYLSGKRSMIQIANDLGLNKPNGAMDRWIRLFREQGANSLLPKAKNSAYTKEFKMHVVEEYVDGQGSAEVIAAKHNVNAAILYKWISLYNSDMELKDYNPKQEVYMAEARRKTTIEERKKIVAYCIDNNRDYKGAAEKYDVSYSQVYNWMRKYDATGEEGLTDKRGHHHLDVEVDELEKLRRENKRLKRQLEERDMTVELLKKVKEFERRRF